MRAGKPIKTYREYLERVIQASKRGMEICNDPGKISIHKAYNKAYKDALRALDKYPIS